MFNGTNIVRGKIWGNTNTIFNKNNVEIARIEIVKGGYCSKHLHEFKFNAFFLEKGKLKVTIFRSDSGQEIQDVTILSPGDITYVEPGLLHFFEAIEECIAYEIYWCELQGIDIVRKSVGGVKSE